MNRQQSLTELNEKIARYKSFVEADPNNAELWFTLGDLYHKTSNFNEALSSFDRCLSILPENNVAHSHKAMVMISQHRFRDAEKIFSKLLRTAPKDVALLFNNALAIYHQERFADAYQYFSLAKDSGAPALTCLPYMVRCQHQLGDLESSIKLCNEWVNVAKDSESKGYLSLLEMDNHNKDSARQLAQSVLRENPDNVEAAIVVASYEVEDQDIEKAETLFDKALQVRPNQPRALFGKGLTQLYKGNHADAIRLIREAADAMPNDTGTRIALGWAQITSQDFIGAEKTFRETIAINRNFAEGHGGLAYVLAMQHKIDQANEEIKTATWLDPHSFGAGAARSVIIGVKGNMERSVKYLANLLEQPMGPGQKPMIEHIQVYLTKRAKQEQNKPKQDDKPMLQ